MTARPRAWRRPAAGAALLGLLIACGDAAPAERVLYDSSPTGPAVGPGRMGDPPTRRIRGNESRWHAHRLRAAGVPLLVQWETIDTHGCSYVLRVVVAREGGDPGTDIRVARAEPPDDAPACGDPPATPDGSPFDTAVIAIDRTGRSAAGDPAPLRSTLTLYGDGTAAPE